jgi:hypothetical protein
MKIHFNLLGKLFTMRDERSILSICERDFMQYFIAPHDLSNGVRRDRWQGCWKALSCLRENSQEKLNGKKSISLFEFHKKKELKLKVVWEFCFMKKNRKIFLIKISRFNLKYFKLFSFHYSFQYSKVCC